MGDAILVIAVVVEPSNVAVVIDPSFDARIERVGIASAEPREIAYLAIFYGSTV